MVKELWNLIGRKHILFHVSDAVVKNSFIKNLNKLKNPPNQFKNLNIKHNMTVDEQKMKDCCKIFQMKKTLHQTKTQKSSSL